MVSFTIAVICKTNKNSTFADLESGVTLLILLEYLTGIQLKYHKTPKSNSQKLENLAIALEFMSAEGINLTAMCKSCIPTCQLLTVLCITTI